MTTDKGGKNDSKVRNQKKAVLGIAREFAGGSRMNSARVIAYFHVKTI